jgi:hypothetical protein
VWDVEDPDEPGCDPAEVQIRNRRIRFYERHGGHLLPVRGYGNPHDDDSVSNDTGSDGRQHWTPMRLMAASTADAGLPGTAAIVAAVYRYRWRLDPDDPQIAATEITANEVAAAGPDHDQKGS